MKPQCNTSADCLRELARVMDQFGIADYFAAVSSKYVKENGRQWDYRIFPEFNLPGSWQFAIAEVEGKPVFPDTLLYQTDKNSNGYGEQYPASYWGEDFRGASWNPPKPATVMVELEVVDAKNELYEYMNSSTTTNRRSRIAQACKTALEKLKS